MALVAFVLSLFLREQKLRSTVTAPDLSESIGLNPVERSSLDEIARSLSVLSTREARRDLFRRITEGAGLDLKPASSWLLLQMHHHGSAEPAELAERRIVPLAVVEEAAREVEDRGWPRAPAACRCGSPSRGRRRRSGWWRPAVSSSPNCSGTGTRSSTRTWRRC